MSDELVRSGLKALGWGYIGALGRAIAALVVQVALARILGPEDFGRANAALLLLTLGWLLGEGGFGIALIQRKQLDDQVVGVALSYVLLLSAMVACVASLTADLVAVWLGDPSMKPLLWLAAALVPLQALSSIPISLMRRELRFRRLQFLQLGAYILGYGLCGVAAALAGLGAWSLLVAYGIQSCFLLISCSLSTHHTMRLAWKRDSSLWSVGSGVSAANLINWAVENLDRLLVTRWWGTAALGAYTAAGSLARAPATFLVGSLSSVALAAGAQIQDDLQRLGRGYRIALAISCLVAVPLFALLGWHAQAVMSLVYGERWAAAAPLLTAMAAAMPFCVALLLTGPILLATGAAHVEWRVQLLAGILLAGGLALGAGWPIGVIVWLVPATYALRWLLMYGALTRRISLPWRATVTSVRGGIGLGVVAILVSWLLTSLFGPNWVAVSASTLLTLVLALALVRFRVRWLLDVELRQALLQHSGVHRHLQMVCCFARLRS